MKTKYDWNNIQKFYDAGNSFRQCKIKFGFASQSWHKAVKSGKIMSRQNGRPIEEYLVKNSRVNRGRLKIRLLRDGYLKNHCYECGQEPEWDYKPLVMVLDHINGINDDYRLDNLRLLCPNCNSQTETFSGRNKKKNK